MKNFFWESDAEILEIITSNPDLIRRAYHKGFIKVGKGIEFWFKAPLGVNLGVDSELIENWHFTHFVSDTYSFD